VQIGGELDVDTTDTAFRYVQKIINRRRGPVVVDLAGVRFCDAQGLGALVRMANYAERAGCPFLVTGPSPMLTKLIRIPAWTASSWRPGRRSAVRANAGRVYHSCYLGGRLQRPRTEALGPA